MGSVEESEKDYRGRRAQNGRGDKISLRQRGDNFNKSTTAINKTNGTIASSPYKDVDSPTRRDNNNFVKTEEVLLTTQRGDQHEYESSSHSEVQQISEQDDPKNLGQPEKCTCCKKYKWFWLFVAFLLFLASIIGILFIVH